METQKKFRFIDPETKEESMVDLEKWCWGVVYKDDTELHQFNSDGSFHQLKEIDQSKIKLWVLHKPGDPNKRIDIVLPEGARIIHKYRNIKPYYLDCFVKVYMFGYRTGKNEKDFKYHYNFILPDDRIIQSAVDNVDLVLFKLTKPV